MLLVLPFSIFMNIINTHVAHFSIFDLLTQLTCTAVSLYTIINKPTLYMKTCQNKTEKNDSNVQGAKKVIFTACHSGKLKLTFTSPNVISTTHKIFDLTVLL